jgi:hypothetical protein
VTLLCAGCVDAGLLRTTQPGEINHVEGSVSLNYQPLSDAQVGTARLNDGQILSTADGHVELLLEPGAFLRLGEDSEIQMAADPAQTRVNLRRGKALVELVQLKARVSILMNGALTTPQAPGLYELEAQQTRTKVYVGEAQVESGGHIVQLRKAQAVDAALRVQRFDSGKGDALYAWSAAASEREAEGSYSAARSLGNAEGGWYWTPHMSCWSFVPQAGIVNGTFGWAFLAPHELSRAILLNGPLFHYPAAVDRHAMPRQLSRLDAKGFVDIAHAPRLHGPDQPYSGDQGPGVPVSPVVIPH